MALSAAQICTLARQAASCPGFTVQSGQILNVILQELCQTYDFDVARKTFYFNFNPGLTSVVGNSIYGSGPYPLPADFLRCAEPKSVFWTLLGVPYPMIPIDLAEFDMAVQQAGLQAYPYWFCTDLSLGDETQQGLAVPSAYVYPPPSGAYPVTVRYYAQMADIASPELSATAPWFPNTQYLRTRLTAELMAISDDERALAYVQQSEEILTRYLRLKDDKSNRSISVKLDRRSFNGNNFARLRNTKQIGW